MTPAEHLAEAERMLGVAVDQGSYEGTQEALGYVLESIGHSLIALAAELGVPHATTTAGGESGAPQA